MARTTTVATPVSSVPVLSKDDFLAQFMAPSQQQAAGVGVISQFIGNRIANVGDTFSAIAGGVHAARANYEISRQAEIKRQGERTYNRLVAAGLVRDTNQ